MSSDQLCERQECSWQYGLLRRQQRLCKICSRPLTLEETASQVCSSFECQRAAVKDYAKYVEQRNQARYEALIQQELEQAQQIYSQVIETFGFKEPQSLPLVVIPALKAKIVNLSAQRRQRFRDHLTALINQALLPAENVSAQPQAPDANINSDLRPNAQAALGLACSRCQGQCCTGGADHAYLQVDTLRRYMTEHPHQRPWDVLAAYLNCIGHDSYDGSCIFHRSDGCALPRTMRADLCNQHYCKALKQFQQQLPSVGPVRAFFAAASGGVVHTAALVHDAQMLVVEMTSPQPPPALADGGTE